MTVREALIQAYTELGMTRENAERRVKCSGGIVPEGAILSYCPVRSGQERVFIDTMKNFFRKLDATPGAREALQAALAKQARKN